MVGHPPSCQPGGRGWFTCGNLILHLQRPEGALACLEVWWMGCSLVESPGGQGVGNAGEVCLQAWPHSCVVSLLPCQPGFATLDCAEQMA